MQDETKTAAMFDLVEQWQQSGLSQNQFCTENGIRLHTLGYWIKKHKQNQMGHEGFATLSLGSERANQPRLPKIEIELAGGFIVRIF